MAVRLTFKQAEQLRGELARCEFKAVAEVSPTSGGGLWVELFNTANDDMLAQYALTRDGRKDA